jgi:putative SOS response-associated peptidase YedK
MDKDTDDLIREFVAAGGRADDWRPSWNIKPTDTIPVVVESSRSGERRRLVAQARWSLVPTWSTDLKLKFPTFNARSETAAEKPFFRDAVKSKRTLVPATGYYEWHTAGKTKTPYFVHDPSGADVVFAGLYSWWIDRTRAADDESRFVLTASILTRPAVGELAAIHDRTPVTLPTEWWDDWLDPDMIGDQALVDAAVAAATPVAEALEFYRVGPVTDNSPELLNPL